MKMKRKEARLKLERIIRDKVASGIKPRQAIEQARKENGPLIEIIGPMIMPFLLQLLQQLISEWFKTKGKMP